jgi:NADH:ubiquinone oxidoreductase subunit C
MHATQINFCLQNKIKKIFLLWGEVVYIKIPISLLNKTLNYLKNTLLFQYTQLTDIAAVDHPKHNLRFTLNYVLLSINYTNRVIIAIQTNELLPIASVTQLYASANVSEREVWDLFGIFFKNHFDLRRILTDYGFKGYPLRKSFPLSGFEETFFNNVKIKLEYPKVQLAQEWRD